MGSIYRLTSDANGAIMRRSLSPWRDDYEPVTLTIQVHDAVVWITKVCAPVVD